LLAGGLLEPIYVPSPELEAVRDLVRAREDARLVRMRDRQRLSKFCLRLRLAAEPAHLQSCRTAARNAIPVAHNGSPSTRSATPSAAILRQQHLEGRLNTDELRARLERCMAAKTYAELDALIADFPRQRRTDDPPRSPGRCGRGRSRFRFCRSR
jgi:Domain of unknown function (DUF1707)